MNNIAYRALVAASNAAHRNAELAAQGVRDIEAQIAQLSVYLERAKDAQRLAESHAASIDAALEKIDAAEAAEGEGSENAPTWMPIETAPKDQTVVVWPPSFRGVTSSAYGDIIQQAIELLESQLRRPGQVFTSPIAARQFAVLKLARQEREVFSVMFLTAQHALIAYEEMFFGTISQASVYPREVVKTALALNAAAVILVHNHPSRVAEPSAADEVLTKSLKASLQLVDVRVLDHIIVGGTETVSMAERGLI